MTPETDNRRRKRAGIVKNTKMVMDRIVTSELWDWGKGGAGTWVKQGKILVLAEEAIGVNPP